MDIRRIRLNTKMTQKEFGEYLGISPRTIQNWEIGRTNPPSYVIELIKYKVEKEKLGMLKLYAMDHGKEEKLTEGYLEDVVGYLEGKYEIFNFIWEGITDEKGINYTTPYKDLEGEERELFEEKMPLLENIETLRELEHEIAKVDLGWWSLKVEEI